MDLTIYCGPSILAPASLLAVPQCLAGFGIAIDRARLTAHRFHERAEFDSLEEFVADLGVHGFPKCFNASLWGRQGEADVWFRLERDIDEEGASYIAVGLKLPAPREPLQAVTRLLGLVPEDPSAAPVTPVRTAFVAHKFDHAGTEMADRVARFLEILGFGVVTGRGYSPQSVAAKVKGRLQEQAVVVVILTPGDDSTWLVQESLLGDIQGKPLFLLKEVTATFKPGLLADREFVPFEGGRIEQTYLPLLEGLRELGYLKFRKPL